MPKVSLCLFVFLFLPLLAYFAEAKELQIWILDKRDFTLIDEVYEGEEFGVYVSDADDPQHYPLSNLTIIFNDQEFYVSVDDPSTFPVCSLWAPEVGKDTVMQIIAKKPGYEDAVREITILNKKRMYIHLLSPVKGGKDLKILVEDEEGKSVDGANVKLIIEGEDVYDTSTDRNGFATLPIPKVSKEKKFLINASKEGFKSAKIEGVIKGASSAFSIPSDLIPILGIIGILIFIFAGVVKYVKKEGEEKMEVPAREKIKEAVPYNQKKIAPGEFKKIRIEEIVVRKPDIQIGSEREERMKVYARVRRTKAKPEEWVLGKDSVIAKIDEKLGSKPKIDVSQWLTGRDDIIEKIDEKLKEYDKKRKGK